MSSKRPSPRLTVNTSFPPPPAPTSSRPPSTKRSSSSSSLLSSPTSATATATTKTTGSPSVATPKCTSPRCSSPACASVDRNSVTLYSPTSSTSRASSSPHGGAISSPPLALPPPISPELYFRLLKKSHVMDQLLHVHSHLESQQLEVRRLEADRARTDSVQAFVFRELEMSKRQFVETQQFLLEVLEALTAVTIKEAELQRGTGSSEAYAIAQSTKEETVLRDLEAHVGELHTRHHHQQPLANGSNGNGPSLESRALRAVGLQRVEQLATVCASYEAQLKKSEAECSHAMHSTYTNELLTKLQRYEAMQQQSVNEITLTTRIDNLTSQTSELQRVIDDQRDELLQLKQTNDAYYQRHTAQTTAIETFGAELKAELRKRYGVVPSVVASRWHTFFPNCTAPE